MQQTQRHHSCADGRRVTDGVRNEAVAAQRFGTVRAAWGFTRLNGL